MYENVLDFGQGEEIDALRDMVRRFARDRIAPIAAEIDRNNDFPAPLVDRNSARSACSA